MKVGQFILLCWIVQVVQDASKIRLQYSSFSMDEAKEKQNVHNAGDGDCPRNSECVIMKRMIAGELSEADLEHLECWLVFWNLRLAFVRANYYAFVFPDFRLTHIFCSSWIKLKCYCWLL